MEKRTKSSHLSEEILTEIQARLPLRSISRFKSVSKTWKTTLESAYLRRRFVSLHQNSCSSFSVMRGVKELIGFHRCETWDLPKSLPSYIPPSFKGAYNFGYEACSNGLVLIGGTTSERFVGNPILQQWVRIPPPPRSSAVLCLATNVDEDGVVLGFKVVTIAGMVPTRTNDVFSTCMSVCLYSSETGLWTSKGIHCPHHIYKFPAMSLNGTIYLSQPGMNSAEAGVVISHDFYSESDQFSVIPLPDQDQYLERAILTTSRGFVMYIKIYEDVLEVWRLMNDSEDCDDDDLQLWGGMNDSEDCDDGDLQLCGGMNDSGDCDDGNWQLWGVMSLPCSLSDDICSYVPMAMHPFDTEIVYVWNQQNHHLLSCNVRKQKYIDLGDDQNCFIDQSACDKYMNEIWGSRSSAWNSAASLDLFQFVLPRWMESVPCPPQAEMIDTTSLLSYITSVQGTKTQG